MPHASWTYSSRRHGGGSWYKARVDTTTILSTLRVHSPTFVFSFIPNFLLLLTALRAVTPFHSLFTMLTAHILALSVLGSALALPKFGSRQDFTDEDLFNSCPGGPGSSKFEKADRCTLVSHTPQTLPLT